MTERRQILAALNAHWRRLSSDSATRLEEWARLEPALAGVPDLPGVLLRIRAEPDATLAALLRLGAGGDPVAFMVLLQAMLGKAVLLTAGRPAARPMPSWGWTTRSGPTARGWHARIMDGNITRKGAVNVFLPIPDRHHQLAPE